MNYGYSDDYTFTMRDAHRRPAQIVRPPALTWHLAYRRPHGIRDSLWYRQIEDRIVAIFMQCLENISATDGDYVRISNLHSPPVEVEARDVSVTRNIPLLRRTYSISLQEATFNDDSDLPIGRYETVIICGNWQSCPYSIRVETIEEGFAITVILELETQEAKKLRLIINELNARLKNHPTTPDLMFLPSNVASAVIDLYDREINDWNDNFLKNLGMPSNSFHASPTGTAGMNTYGNNDKPLELKGLLFANFRGLVLKSADYPDKNNSEKSFQFETADRKNEQVASRVTNGSKQLKGKGNLELEIVQAVLPILLAQDGITSDSTWKPPFEPTDYTFSTLRNRRFIYGSGFGPQMIRDVREGQSPAPGVPLCYLLVCLHNDWREAGHVVLGLHTSGMLRLMALFELRKLIKRDQTLRRLECELRELHKLGGIAKSENLKEQREKEIEEVQRLLKRLLESFTKNPFKEIVEGHDIALNYFISKAKKIIKYGSRSAGFLHFIGRIKLKRDLINVCEQLEKVANILAKRDSRIASKNKLLGDVEHLIRSMERFQNTDSPERFRETVLNQVRASLADMDLDIREGIAYCTQRSTYARTMFSSLSNAMNIRPISGFVPYDLFVKQRLDRSYGLLQAIGRRFEKVFSMESQQRQALESHKSSDRQNSLQHLQTSAEWAFWLVLAPYYISHNMDFSFIDTLCSSWNRDSPWPTCNLLLRPIAVGVVVGVLALSISILTRIWKHFKQWLISLK